MQQERYWDYMGRRLKECLPETWTEKEIMRKEIVEQNAQVYKLYARIKELSEKVHELETELERVVNKNANI